VLLAVGLRRAAVGLGRLTRLPVGVALAVVVLLILAFFAAVGWFFSQGIASQINQLSRLLPVAFEKLAGIVGRSGLGRTVIQHLGSANIQTSPTSIVQDFLAQLPIW
jgi:predicted PurR-regulated permease PerM